MRPFRSTRTATTTYACYAFWNPYNVSLFVGGIVLGVASHHLWLSGLSCVVEALWIGLAPRSKVLRAVWFDRRFASAKEKEEAARRAKELRTLGADASLRLDALRARKVAVERLAKDHGALSVDLVSVELAKLMEDFVEAALIEARVQRHVAAFDFGAIVRSWEQYASKLARSDPGEPMHEVAKKNIEVLRRRHRTYDELWQVVLVARAQMDLVEQTFRLVGDEILTMTKPRGVGSGIYALRVAVDAIGEADDDDAYAFVDDSDILEVHEAAPPTLRSFGFSRARVASF